MKISLETKTGAFDFVCEPDEPILYAGLRNGLVLPYECATGTCGTCRGRVMQGDVEVAWDAAPGHAKLKRDKGDVLMCQTRARGDCVVRVPANVTPCAEDAGRPDARTGKMHNLRRLTRDVIDFDVVLDRPVGFEGGQFVVMTAPGVEGGRAYSMVNYEETTERLRFVVKRKPGGGFSDWLFDGAAEGAEVRLFGPLGAATYRPAEAVDLVFIAGGSGIAGLMSILEAAHRNGHFRRHAGQVFFGVRTMADIFYADELARLMAGSEGNLEVTVALSHEAPPAASHPSHPDVKLAEGFVHEIAASRIGQRTEPTIGFVAGPPPMVDAAIRVLIVDAGLGPQSIRYDKFS